MIKVPPYLQKDDTIGLVCPAGFMAMERVETCIRVLQNWGYRVRVGETVGSHSDNYFSGTDEDRLNDLQKMLDDKNIKAIMCARGGYGVSRIVDKIDFRKFKKHPKWIIGYSDITVLHSHIFSNYNISGLHAPMAAAFDDEEYRNEYVQSLQNVLSGKKIHYSCNIHPLNKKGKAKGELVGGNLSLLVNCIGTASDIKTKGKILFIEDVGEQLYNIDRMLYQMKRSGKLSKLSALIIGGFTEVKDTERPFGKNVYELISDIVKEYRYPVCFNFPVSHDKENYALKTGVKYTLKVGDERIELYE